MDNHPSLLETLSFFIRHPCSRLMPRLCDTTAWKWRDCTAEFYSNTFFFPIFHSRLSGRLDGSVRGPPGIFDTIDHYNSLRSLSLRPLFTTSSQNGQHFFFFWKAVFTCLNWEVVLFLPQLSRKGRGALQSIPPRPVVIYRPRDEFEAATGRPRTEQWILTRPLPSRVGQV